MIMDGPQILEKVQSLPELQIQTPMNKIVVSNIQCLMTLEEDRRKNLEDLLVVIQSKVQCETACCNVYFIDQIIPGTL